MFNTQLSDAQVLAIYNLGIPKDESSHAGLIGYWRMGDDGSVFNIIDDDSSNNNSGIMTNMVAADIETVVP